MKTILIVCLLLCFHSLSFGQQWKKSAKDFELFYGMADSKPVLKLSVPLEAFKDDDEDDSNNAQNKQTNKAASRLMEALSSLHADQFYLESDKYEYGYLEVWCHTRFDEHPVSYADRKLDNAKLYSYSKHIKEHLEEGDEYWLHNTFGDISNIKDIQISRVDTINGIPIILLEFECLDNKKTSKVFCYIADIQQKVEWPHTEDYNIVRIMFHFDKTKTKPEAFTFAKDIISTVQLVK